MTTGLRVARLGAVLLTATALSLGAALPAAAQTKARVDRTVNEGNAHVRLSNGQSYPALLIGLRLADGTALKTYCVELTVPVRDDAQMIEAPWDQYPASDGNGSFKSSPEKVNWILHNSYPTIDTETLSKTVGADLDRDEAIAGTQSAIWHFSNKINLAEQNNPDVKALYAYLIGEKNVGYKPQPAASLSLTPAELAGAAGKNIGPFVVKSTAQQIKLTLSGPAGVKVVDNKGKEVKEAINGQELYVSVPADAAAGKASFTVEATAKIDKGRLFIAADGKPSQTLILAQATIAKLSAQAKASWTALPPATTTTTPKPTTATSTTTPPPAVTTPVQRTGGLANTGASSVLLFSLGGLILITAGVLVLVLQRRRKNTA